MFLLDTHSFRCRSWKLTRRRTLSFWRWRKKIVVRSKVDEMKSSYVWRESLKGIVSQFLLRTRHFRLSWRCFLVSEGSHVDEGWAGPVTKWWRHDGRGGWLGDVPKGPARAEESRRDLDREIILRGNAVHVTRYRFTANGRRRTNHGFTGVKENRDYGVSLFIIMRGLVVRSLFLSERGSRWLDIWCN